MACKYLIKKGFEIIDRNFYTKHGEIDIIAFDGKRTCFVEVKTRTRKDAYPPKIAVNNNKRKRLMITAQKYMRMNKIKTGMRFDVCEVYIIDKRCFVKYIRAAFSADDCFYEDDDCVY